MVTLSRLEAVIAETLALPAPTVRKVSTALKTAGYLHKAPHRGQQSAPYAATAGDAAKLLLALVAPPAFDGLTVANSGAVIEALNAVDFVSIGSEVEARTPRGAMLVLPCDETAVFTDGLSLRNEGIATVLALALVKAQAGVGQVGAYDLDEILFSRVLGVPVCHVTLRLWCPVTLDDYPHVTAERFRLTYADANALAGLEAQRGTAGGRELILNKRALGLVQSAAISGACVERIGQALGALSPADAAILLRYMSPPGDTPAPVSAVEIR